MIYFNSTDWYSFDNYVWVDFLGISYLRIDVSWFKIKKLSLYCVKWLFMIESERIVEHCYVSYA